MINPINMVANAPINALDPIKYISQILTTIPKIWITGKNGDFQSGLYHEWDFEDVLNTITQQLIIIKIIILNPDAFDPNGALFPSRNSNGNGGTDRNNEKK